MNEQQSSFVGASLSSLPQQRSFLRMYTEAQKYPISSRRASSTFRETLKSYYPGLANNEAYWHMMGYLAFSNSVDRISGKLKISVGVLASMERKEQQLKSNNYVGKKFLNAFIRDVQPFKYSEWDSEERLCRIVTEINWPPLIAQAIKDEISRRWKASPKVYLHTGEPVTNNKERKIRENTRREALETIEYSKCELAKSLLLLLNNQPQNRFYKTLIHYNDAVDVAKIKASDPDREIALLNLSMYDYQPFYQAVPNSSRIYPFGENILGAKREVRQTMTQDHIEFDLKSAQVAIAAAIWNVRKVQKFLKGGGSIWNYIFEEMYLEFSQERKAIFKEAIYALMYGSHKGKLKGWRKSGLVNIFARLDKPNAEILYKKFIELPLIHSLLLGRRRMFKKIKKEGGAMTCFNQWLKLDTSTHKNRNKGLRSILSQLNHAYELKLLEPVIAQALVHAGHKAEAERLSDLVFENYGSSFSRGFSITYWQHDGFSIAPKNSADRQKIINNLQNLIRKQAKSLDIITQLEVKNP